MPPSVDIPLQARIPIPVLDRSGSGALQTRPVGCWRIFAQTDTGSVLGVEIDRVENVQSVKKMQSTLNLPTEQTALVFGDPIFKRDLNELRNDSPLHLTRELQRSLSTPCIYPSSDAQVLADGGQPFEVVGGLTCCQKMKGILKEINKAINCGVEPVAVTGGLGGAYYFRNSSGESVAFVKPTDEEPFAPNNPKGFVGRSLGQPGLKKAVRVGETGVREVAAYLLDHQHFANVPPTVLVQVSHRAFHVNGAAAGLKGIDKSSSPVAKIASCQQFVPHDYDASDLGTSRFSVAAVHRIGILDIRIFNTDRHAGNILIRNAKAPYSQRTWSCSNVHVNESLELIPIDHGLCLPEALEDPYFEWLHWPQSSLPFSEEELDYIKGLDEYKDAEMLRRELPMLREACCRMLILSTTLLKIAAAAGFCLAEIGEMMSRDGLEEASYLELLCMQAKLQSEKDLSLEKLYYDEDSDEDACDGALSENFVGEDLHEQFEVEMDHELDLKFSMIDEAPLFSRKGDCPNLSAFGHPFIPVALTPLNSFSHSFSLTVSAKTLHISGFPQVLHEVSAVQEEDGLKSPSAAREGPWSGGSGSLQRLTRGCKSDMGSPRGVRAECNPRLRPDFCPLVEEEEDVLVFADTNVKIGRASLNADLVSPRAMSYRSGSLCNWKQRHLDHTKCKAPASVRTGKVNIYGGSPLFSLGDMEEEEWASFMYNFQELLEEALVSRCEQSVTHRQRLGISCQF